MSKPILFSGPMVRALREGRKTQTRRVVKAKELAYIDEHQGFREPNNADVCPYGQPGDLLWVRETWGTQWSRDGVGGVRTKAIYRATGDEIQPGMRWKPSIHMPRWASRLTLRIKAVRVERLQEISEADALDEGITYHDLPNNGLDPMRARTWYRGLWTSINGPDSWSANPFVWVLAFDVIHANIDQVIKEAP